MTADIAQLKTQMKMIIRLLAVVAESKGHESLEEIPPKQENQSPRSFDPLPVTPSQLLPLLLIEIGASDSIPS